MTRTLALTVALSLLIPAVATPQTNPFTGTISSPSGTICFPVQGYPSVRVAVSGTFVAWYKFVTFADDKCARAGAGAHMRNVFYGIEKSISNTLDVWDIYPMSGVQSVQMQIYDATADHGYTSGTIVATFSASMAPPPGDGTKAHYDGLEMSTRPACTSDVARAANALAIPPVASSYCSPPAVSAVGKPVTLTLYNEISQNIFLYGIYITATGADASVRVSIDDGDDGEAVPFGTQRISADGAAWERTGAPLYVARVGNNLYIRVTGSPGSVIQINAVAKR